MGLTDSVKDGDVLNAYVYTDLTAWSDTFCYFDVNTATAETNEEITITLTAAGYDENFNPITYPVSGATITFNGNDTEYTTDENGKVTIKADVAGTITVSATSTEKTLVPPALLFDVTETVSSDTNAGDSNTTFIYVLMLAGSAILMTVSASKKTYEA